MHTILAVVIRATATAQHLPFPHPYTRYTFFVTWLQLRVGTRNNGDYVNQFVHQPLFAVLFFFFFLRRQTAFIAWPMPAIANDDDHDDGDDDDVSPKRIKKYM